MRGRLGERTIELLIWLCGVSSIIFVFGIFVFLFREGADFLVNRLSIREFFGSARWDPTIDPPEYGVLGQISGTGAVSIVSMVFAVPFSLGTAVLISEFCRPRTKESLKVLIELLAAIPSVVWGFIGIGIMHRIVSSLTGAPIGVGVLNGSIILALMSVPIIVSIAEDALKAVPDSYREAAEALGATRWQVGYKVLFPAAKSGLLAAVLLGVGRVVGETMAVLMATGQSNRVVVHLPFQAQFPFIDFGGIFSKFPYVDILEPCRTLTATIAAELGETAKGSDHYQVLFVIGLLLFAITFVINLVADLVVRGIRRD